MFLQGNQVQIQKYINIFKQRLINHVIDQEAADVELVKVINNLQDSDIIYYALEAISLNDDFFAQLIEREKAKISEDMPL